MCIIVTKKQDFALPNEATLRRCFTSNPDGAGFAWSDDKKVYWRKGYETFEAFYEALKTTFPDETIEKQHAIVLHFRIGTHGPKKSKSHMHPFPVDVLTLQQTTELEGSASMVLFHNGVISDITRGNTDKVMSDNIEVDPSDSMILAYHYVRPMLKAFDLGAIEASTFNLFMEKFIGTSRIALLEPAGIIDYYGSWVEDETLYPGCSFSNSGYAEPKVIEYKGGYRSPGYFDDYDNDYWGMANNTIVPPRVKPIESVKWEPWTHKDTEHTTTVIDTDKNPPMWNAFWKKHAKVKLVNMKGIYKLPLGTRVVIKHTKSAMSKTTYTPAIDGELYYKPQKLMNLTDKPNELTMDALVYVKENGNYYYIATYTIILNGEAYNAKSVAV